LASPVSQLIDLARASRVFDLSQPFYVGMPHFPTHPPFAYSLGKLHGEFVLKNGGSSASEVITMGGHSGTHIDALNHFSCAGKLFGGVDYEQAAGTGVRPHSVDTVPPVVRRGVLLDVAGSQGVPILSEEFVIDHTIDADPSITPDKWNAFYTDAIKKAGPGVTLVTIHLAYDDEEMRGVTVEHPDWGAAWRQRDFDYFTSDAFRQLLKDNDIKLVTYRDLGRAMAMP